MRFNGPGVSGGGRGRGGLGVGISVRDGIGLRCFFETRVWGVCLRGKWVSG